jgi:hypothetical protein
MPSLDTDLKLSDYWGIASGYMLWYHYNANNIYFSQMYDCQRQAENAKKGATPSVYSVVGSAIWHLVNGMLQYPGDVASEASVTWDRVRLIVHLEKQAGEVVTLECKLKKPQKSGTDGLNPVDPELMPAKQPTNQIYRMRLVSICTEMDFKGQRGVYWGDPLAPPTVFPGT